MWKCPGCGERVDEKLDVCWNCGTSPDGTRDADFGSEPLERGAPSRHQRGRPKPFNRGPSGVVYLGIGLFALQGLLGIVLGVARSDLLLGLVASLNALLLTACLVAIVAASEANARCINHLRRSLHRQNKQFRGLRRLLMERM